MKFLLSLIIAACLFSPVHAQQFDLFGVTGKDGAYIDYDKDATLYTWDGRPVGFLETRDNIVHVFGLTGEFMGWYELGLMYDKQGYVVAAKEKAPIHKSAQNAGEKGAQKAAPARPTSTKSAPPQPSLKSEWSAVPLNEFLLVGKK